MRTIKVLKLTVRVISETFRAKGMSCGLKDSGYEAAGYVEQRIQVSKIWQLARRGSGQSTSKCA